MRIYYDFYHCARSSPISLLSIESKTFAAQFLTSLFLLEKLRQLATIVSHG